MLANIALPLLLAGFASASAQTQDVISFPFAGDGYYTQIPTAGVSGSIVDVKSARTTLAYQCASAASDVAAYSTAGVLCPLGSNRPVTVTYGNNYWGQETTVSANSITATAEQACQVTAKPASSGGGASATASPVCTLNFGGNQANAIAALVHCAKDLEDINTASVFGCYSAALATPTNAATLTFKPENVQYWTVTVTAVAKGVNTAAASATATSASATASATSADNDNAGAGNAVSRLAIAGAVGLAGVVLAL